MKCGRCQSDNRDGVRFCEECGSRLVLNCTSCGAEILPDKRFCGSCGTPVAAPATERFASPQGYTPKHLAEKILTSKGALEGERKQVTVLFADLKGSMELLADRDPEEARKLLDPVLERMMEAVHRYEGTVNQVMGDGIMALFGAPLAHEDHAVRASRAAIRMQETVGWYAEELRRSQGIDVQIRVGLNSGEVVVRAIDSDLHMDYSAIGQTTHLAARMEQLARPGTTLITGETLRLAEGYVEVKPLGPVPVKGLPAPVEVYEIVRFAPLRSRLQAEAARGLTPFVGREVEVDKLRQALDRAGQGHGQLVAVAGDPGVGKSRLFWEFTHSHRAHGWLIIECAAMSHGKAISYLPVSDLLRTYFRIDERDTERRIREKVTGKILTLDESLRPTLPAFFQLLDLPAEDEEWQSQDPAQRRQRTLDAVKRLLLRESQVQPLLLIFENLQWIDSETQAFLDSLVESLPAARTLVLVSYRPEYQHGWGSKTYYTQFRMDPLPAASAEELLHALLGEDLGLVPLKQLLIKRTEGNPFFLEESVRTLVETKALAGEPGSYRLAREVYTIQVPPTVQAVLAARIDRLPVEAKRLLQAAAVIGTDVPLALVQAITELPEDMLRRHLTQLQAAEFIYEISLFPSVEYTFKHALTHDVAYSTLLQERRRALHARIVAAIEHLHADRLAEQVERLAHHALRGEVWDKAVAYLRQAGAKAAARAANREAVILFEQSLVAVQHLPEGRKTTEQAIDLRLDLRPPLLQLGQLERVLALSQEAEAMAEKLGDEQRLARVYTYLINYYYLKGEPELAIEYGERCLRIGEAARDPALSALARSYLGYSCHAEGRYRRAESILKQNIEALEGVWNQVEGTQAGITYVTSSSWLGFTLAEARGVRRRARLSRARPAGRRNRRPRLYPDHRTDHGRALLAAPGPARPRSRPLAEEPRRLPREEPRCVAAYPVVAARLDLHPPWPRRRGAGAARRRRDADRGTGPARVPRPLDGKPRRGAARHRSGRARPHRRPTCPRPGNRPQGARPSGLGAATARRHRGGRRTGRPGHAGIRGPAPGVERCAKGGGVLWAISAPGRGSRNASPRRPEPPGTGPALPAGGQPREGRGVPRQGDHCLVRSRCAVLVQARRERAGGAGPSDHRGPPVSQALRIPQAGILGRGHHGYPRPPRGGRPGR